MRIDRRGALVAILLAAVRAHTSAQEPGHPTGPNPSPATIRDKVLCGYQGWFRCPGDPASEGWVHWSRDARSLRPETLTFEMWPDMSEYGDDERYAAPGFVHADGRPAFLFSSVQPKTVSRHFRWMRDHDIDGVLLQQFLVDMPGGPIARRDPSRRLVLKSVIRSAAESGRVWALAYDTSGMPAERMYDVLTTEWKRVVDAGITAGPNYLHEGGKPVVEVWGFYRHGPNNAMTPERAHRLIDFFKAEGRYSAFLIGGGDWDWRRDAAWREVVYRFDAYSPWNVGNYVKDDRGEFHASTSGWAADRRECDRRGVLWLPVVYPGFSWDNLRHRRPGSSTIPRRGGRFYWEQFGELSRLGVRCTCVAMFDEVDEGTAIFKVTNNPPRPGHFVTYDGLPSDWYLRLTGEGAKVLRGERRWQESLPIAP